MRAFLSYYLRLHFIGQKYVYVSYQRPTDISMMATIVTSSEELRLVFFDRVQVLN